MVPQIIYMILLVINLVLIGKNHNKPKEGKYNMWTSLLALACGVLLIWWGGFFDPLFK